MTATRDLMMGKRFFNVALFIDVWDEHRSALRPGELPPLVTDPLASAASRRCQGLNQVLFVYRSGAPVPTGGPRFPQTHRRQAVLPLRWSGEPRISICRVLPCFSPSAGDGPYGGAGNGSRANGPMFSAGPVHAFGGSGPVVEFPSWI